MGFSLVFRTAEGLREVKRRAVVTLARVFCRLCGSGSMLQCEVVGVEFGHSSFSVVEHNRTMDPQRNVSPPHPPTAIIIRRGPLNQFK